MLEELYDKLMRLRREIDEIDKELIKLLDKRMEIIRQIWKIKSKAGIPIINRSREIEILKRSGIYRSVFREIIKLSRKVQLRNFFNIYEFFDKLSNFKLKIRLDAGMPDVPVDDRIISALVKSLNRGETNYVSVNGINELREKIAEIHGVEVNEVIIGPGSKFLVASQVRYANKLGIISPYWPGYVRIAEEFDKYIHFLRANIKNGWRPNFNKMPVDIDTIIINYPNNPTGIILSRDHLEELIDMARHRRILVISDEIYRDIFFEEKPPSIIDYNYENSVFIHSFSKTFSMAGFRIGYAIAERKIIKQIRRFLEGTITCMPEFVQRAALKALELRDEISEKVRKIYKKRLELALKNINKEIYEFIEPSGAFYIFLHVKSDTPGLELTYKLAKEGVGVFPGIAFGNYNNYIRISLTDANLIHGIIILNRVGENI